MFSRKTVSVIAMQSVNKKVIFRICGRGRGWAFSSNDFVEDFSRSQIDYALSELCREGTMAGYPRQPRRLKLIASA